MLKMQQSLHHFLLQTAEALGGKQMKCPAFSH
jgi:hypothetical protein